MARTNQIAVKSTGGRPSGTSLAEFERRHPPLGIPSRFADPPRSTGTATRQAQSESRKETRNVDANENAQDLGTGIAQRKIDAAPTAVSNGTDKEMSFSGSRELGRKGSPNIRQQVAKGGQAQNIEERIRSVKKDIEDLKQEIKEIKERLGESN